MMSTRRALGIVMMVAVLLAPAGAQGQTVMDVTDAISAVTVLPTVPASHDMIQVSWTFVREGAAIAASTDKFRIYYRAGADALDTTALENATGTMDVAVPTVGLTAAAQLTGLKAETAYTVVVARVRTVTASGVSTIAGAAAGNVPQTTAAAPMPDRVLNVVIDSSADNMLKVSWDAPYAGAAGLTIKEYEVKYNTSKTDSMAAGTAMTAKVTGTMATLSNLMMGTMYDVQVRAVNSAGGMGEYSVKMTATPGMAGTPTPTPTPALPVFGAFALGAGLLAAGRRRLRRRQQLLNS